MKRETSLAIATVLVLLIFNSCKDGIPSPYFAKVEVLDENDVFISGCSFSLSYNGNKIPEDEIFVDFYNHSQSDEDITWGFKGKKWYEIGTNFFSDIIRKDNDPVNEIVKFKITVSKNGYEPLEFTPTPYSIEGSGWLYYGVDIIVLKKIDASPADDVAK